MARHRAKLEILLSDQIGGIGLRGDDIAPEAGKSTAGIRLDAFHSACSVSLYVRATSM